MQMLSVTFYHFHAEYHHSGCTYVDCCYADCRYAECHKSVQEPSHVNANAECYILSFLC